MSPVHTDLHQANQSPLALGALNRIGRLYAIEAEAKDLDCEARKSLRIERSQRELDALYVWLRHTRTQTAHGGASAKAIDYLLIRYAETGHLPIDNNAIRPIALGRKNWLFVGSERAGHRAAAIQSLLGTAQLNGLDPAAWLKETLEKLPVCPNRRIDELLPFPPGWLESQGVDSG